MTAELARASAVIERWRPIPGYEGLYDVSDLGRVRSWSARRGAVPRIKTIHRLRYPTVSLHDEHGKNHRWRLHELVLLAFVGPRPAGMEEIRHLDGDSLNNAPANLRYGTRSENAQDALRHGDNAFARRTHCPNGHEYSAENTRICRRGDGREFRQCRICARGTNREAMRRRRARLRAAS